MSKNVITLWEAGAAIFDMDGVITNTMPYHFQAWEIAFRDIVGLKISEQDIYLREGSKGSFALEEIFTQYGWAHDPQTLTRLLERKEEVFPQIAKQEFVDGAVEFLDLIHDAGFAMALVTGTSREELTRILPDYIRSRFSAVVTGSDVVHGKPNPEPYRRALELLQLPPSAAFVVENAPLGIRSAKAAGLRCLALETSLSAEFLSEADAVFSSFAMLRQRIQFVYRKEDHASVKDSDLA